MIFVFHTVSSYIFFWTFSLHRYRRDARSVDEDEELWFNDDDDDDDSEAVEKSRMEDDFSDSYSKYMEAKKGNRSGVTEHL